MIIGWVSGGVTSAVACKLAIELYGLDAVRLIFIDTHNEDPDTYRFLEDCEKWYGKKIEHISGCGLHSILKDKYNTIQDTWLRYNSLNVANGAICSSILKRDTRKAWEKNNVWEAQVFGFDIKESKRAMSMKLNNPHTLPIFPLLFYALRKVDCIKILDEAGVEIPRMYRLGFHNNNCFLTGCVQGGIGYWQKIRDEYPEKFEAMAAMEHRLTNRKGKPVTMLRHTEKKVKYPLFLKKHPDYPEIKCISDKKPMKVKPLAECNGFCGLSDLD